ncbi:MAG: hypothetical protein AABX38_01490 [Candidatus Micrarchaeota archaeon]
MHERPKYSNHQKFLVLCGFILSISGVFIVSIGKFGLLDFFNSVITNPSYLLFGSGTAILFGAATYFTFLSDAKEKQTEEIYLFSNFLSSLICALFILLVFSLNFFPKFQDRGLNNYLYPFSSGVLVFLAVLFAFKAFTRTHSKKGFEQTIISIIVNSEAIPILLISYVLLSEFVPFAFAGTILAIMGLSLINYAAKLK